MWPELPFVNSSSIVLRMSGVFDNSLLVNFYRFLKEVAVVIFLLLEKMVFVVVREKKVLEYGLSFLLCDGSRSSGVVEFLW